MKETDASSAKARRTSHADRPAIQVICLGSGGGPSEDNVTGFLVRSTASEWAKGSLLAVDAGSHLAAITRILQEHFPLVSETQQTATSLARSATDGGFSSATPQDGQADDENPAETSSSSESEASPTDPPKTLMAGAFAGLPFPHESARANAVHVVREHVSTYLITHPHLDHVSGFVINTAAFHNTSRPKRLAALPSTVNAIKTHIFNDIIWPNLTDEDGGVGFVTFQRLAEGGNIALGEGPGSGFIEVCDGLGVKGFKVSHGHCMRGPPGYLHRGSIADLSDTPVSMSHSQHSQHSRPLHPHLSSAGRDARSTSISYAASQPGTPLPGASMDTPTLQQQCVIDSTAYFIRAEATSNKPAREILVFGDVEPDSISLSPRTFLVWREAAPKIAQGILTGIFIECSYNDSQGDAVLFGHLAPRHLIQELLTLGQMVREERAKLEREREESRKAKKRKRTSNSLLSNAPNPDDRADSPRITRRHSHRLEGSHPPETPTRDSSMTEYTLSPPLTATLQSHPASHLTPIDISLPTAHFSKDLENPLQGVKVVVIHVKDTLCDGRVVGESILEQLQEHEQGLAEEGKGLGCEFIISKSGESYWF